MGGAASNFADNFRSDDIDITAKHASSNEISADPPANIKTWIKSHFKCNDARAKEIYDAVVEGAVESFTSENLEFLSLMAQLHGSSNHKKLQAAYNKFIKLGSPRQINIEHEIRTKLDAADGSFKTKENNIKAGAWLEAKQKIERLFTAWIDSKGFRRTQAYKKHNLAALATAHKQYYNELDLSDSFDNALSARDYGYNMIDDEFYDNNDYELEQARGQNIGGGINGYNIGYKQGYNNGYRFSKSIGYGVNGSSDPTMYLLIGVVIFVVFLLFGLLLNVISCAGGYIFGKMVANPKNNENNKNEYENINQI